MISANDITLPSPPATLSRDAPAAEVDAIFRRLRQLLMDVGKANSHDRLTVAIAACIDEGIDTGNRIVGVAQKLGFDTQHAGIVLSAGIGSNWHRTEDGQYRNLI